MEFSTSTIMMITFIIVLIISIWKIYAFLPNEELVDDDKNEQSEEELLKIVINNIKSSSKVPTNKELFDSIINDSSFDATHYWRFNQNRLNHILINYYSKNPHAKSIEDIYNSPHV